MIKVRYGMSSTSNNTIQRRNTQTNRGIRDACMKINLITTIKRLEM